MKRTHVSAAAIAALMLGFAHAAIRVDPDTFTGFAISVSGPDVTISGPGVTGAGGRHFTIFSDSVSGDDLGIVSVTNTGASNTSIQISIVGYSSGPANNLTSVIRESGSTGEVWLLYANVNGNVGTYDHDHNDRGGSIVVNRIGTLTTNRNLYADIVTRGSNLSSDPDIGILEVTNYNAEFYSDGGWPG